MNIMSWINPLLVFLTYNAHIIVHSNIAQAHILPIMLSPPDNFESVIESVPAVRNEDNFKQFSKIEIIPKGAFILRGKFSNGIRLPNLSILKSILDATKVTPTLAHSNGKWNIKIYGDGTELKFPPFFERILQRIQTYFSVYKYTDTSEVLSTIISEENLSLQVTVEPTKNETTPTTLSFSVASLNENTNKKAEDMFEIGYTDLNSQHDSFLDIESPTQEDCNKATEFIDIADNTKDFIVVRED